MDQFCQSSQSGLLMAIKNPSAAWVASLTFKKLLKTGSHDVDVFDPHKLEADVGVVILVLVALPRRSVGQRIQLWHTIPKLKLMYIGINGLQ